MFSGFIPKGGQGWVGYAVAATGIFVAWALTTWLWPDLYPTPLPIFLLATILVSWVGGMGPGLVTVVATALITNFFLDERGPDLLTRDLRLLTFVATAVAISWLTRKGKHVQRELEGQRRWLEATLASIGDGVIVADIEGRVTFINRVASQLTGEPSEQAVGRPIEEILKAQGTGSEAGLARRVRHVLKTGTAAASAQFDIPAEDGESCTIEHNTSPVLGERDRVLGVVLVFRDITERRQAELARQEADRRKDEFLAAISHELRTPLTSILGWLQRLRAGKLDESQTEKALEIVHRNARQQLQIISDMLDVSSIIKGKLSLELEAVDVAAVITSAIETLKPAADARSIQVRADLRTAGPYRGDPNRLRQVVWNLLSNAIKFSPAGSGVDVQLNRIGAEIVISVKDEGIGIAPDFLPYVFDRFRQADSRKSRKYGGLGLGLALVRHLVELHGGAVEAFSEGENSGARFTVRLPSAAGHPERVLTRDQGKAKAISASENVSP